MPKFLPGIIITRQLFGTRHAKSRSFDSIVERLSESGSSSIVSSTATSSEFCSSGGRSDGRGAKVRLPIRQLKHKSLLQRIRRDAAKQKDLEQQIQQCKIRSEKVYDNLGCEADSEVLK